MILILKRGTTPQDVENLTSELTTRGVEVCPIVGKELSILGLVGDTRRLDCNQLEANPLVERLVHVAEPYKKANVLFHPKPTVVEINGRKIGGDSPIALIAGPCSVESEEQICVIAKAVKEAGAGFLRGGAFKPRTSPYAFQGLKYDGLELLHEARDKTGLPIVTEITSPYQVEAFERDVDVIQVGARNMQNFELLKELGKTHKPVLLKRGLSSTIDEWLMSAEYLMAGGNERVILCERGIRTFETYTRNTLDLSAILAVKKQSHLPVIVDPSHATGKSWMVAPLAKAAIAAGADGLIVEVHSDPANALCDGPQSVTPAQFSEMVADLRLIAQAVGRSL